MSFANKHDDVATAAHHHDGHHQHDDGIIDDVLEHDHIDSGGDDHDHVGEQHDDGAPAADHHDHRAAADHPHDPPRLLRLQPAAGQAELHDRHRERELR